MGNTASKGKAGLMVASRKPLHSTNPLQVAAVHSKSGTRTTGPLHLAAKQAPRVVSNQARRNQALHSGSGQPPHSVSKQVHHLATKQAHHSVSPQAPHPVPKGAPHHERLLTLSEKLKEAEAAFPHLQAKVQALANDLPNDRARLSAKDLAERAAAYAAIKAATATPKPQTAVQPPKIGIRRSNAVRESPESRNLKRQNS